MQQQVVLASESSDSDGSDSSSAEEDNTLETRRRKGNARRRMDKKKRSATDAEAHTDPSSADGDIGDIKGGGSPRLSTGASKRPRPPSTRKILSFPRRAKEEASVPPLAKTRKPSSTSHDVATAATTTTPPPPPVSTSVAYDSPEVKANDLSLSAATPITTPSVPEPNSSSSPRAAARQLPDALEDATAVVEPAMTTHMKSPPIAAVNSATRNSDGGDGDVDRRIKGGGRSGVDSEPSGAESVGSVGRRARKKKKGGTVGGGGSGRRGSLSSSGDRQRPGESGGGMTARIASAESARESPTTANRAVDSDAPVDTVAPSRRHKRGRTDGEKEQHRQERSVSPANQVAPSALPRASDDTGKPTTLLSKKNSERKKKKKKRTQGAESSAGGRSGGGGGAAAIDDIFDSIC